MKYLKHEGWITDERKAKFNFTLDTDGCGQVSIIATDIDQNVNEIILREVKAGCGQVSVISIEKGLPIIKLTDVNSNYFNIFVKPFNQYITGCIPM